MSEAEVLESLQKMSEKFKTEKNQKRFRKWNKTLAFSFTDLEKTYTITVNAGVPSEPEEMEPEKADIWVTIDSATWIGIMDGNISAMNAYTKGQIKIKGKMPDLLKMQKLM
ncbi:MAG: SCP2 sterol-binding domain-containing protein [Candidatus Hodarchaeota archaeon]